jgi:hypothetical protein
MDAKLTLKLDKNVIDEAKKYAVSNKISLSRMVESYLKSLKNYPEQQDNNEFEISAFVNSLKTGVKLPEDLDYKEEYRNFLEEKYK